MLNLLQVIDASIITRYSFYLSFILNRHSGQYVLGAHSTIPIKYN